MDFIYVIYLLIHVGPQTRIAANGEVTALSIVYDIEVTIPSTQITPIRETLPSSDKYLPSRWITSESDLITPDVERNTQQMEDQFLTDLILASRDMQHMNYIFVGVGLISFCQTNTCEKYTTRDMEASLQKRGQRLQTTMNTQRDVILGLDKTRNHITGSSNRDVVLLKFDDLTDTTKNVVLQVRKYNAKSYIVILTEDARVFHDMKSCLLAEKIYNVYVIRRGNNLKYYSIYEICAFCEGGVTTMKMSNVWNPRQGFIMDMKYQSSFQGQFFGAAVKIGLRPVVPSYYIAAYNTDGSPIYSGTAHKLVLTLSTYLNFNPIVIVPKDSFRCLDKTKLKLMTGGWCKMLFEKEVEMSGFPGDISYGKIHFLDPTAIYYTTGKKVYV